MAIFTAIAIGLTIVSMAYQVIQQQALKKKAEREKAAAEALADARKGFEVTIEGEVSALCKPYGRNKLGGVRVYHRTASEYTHVAGNADKVFTAGSLKLPTTLPKKISGQKNEFLIFQQVICKGKLTAVYDIVIDDHRKLTDPDLVKDTTGFRVDIHYGGTPVSCNLLNAQRSDRMEAKFPETSYLTAIVKLDRDDPQFSSVPSISLFTEGNPIRKVVSGILQSNEEYDNCPPWILLDYLLVEEGIPASRIDLSSFEAAATICNTMVKTNAPVGGSIWQPSDGSRLIEHRNLPLYEANLLIDTSKPFRENVQIILETMGDARLVWSQGKYKLSLQYPESNAEIVTGDFIDNDRLVLGTDIGIKWPGADTRLNSATIKYSNEANDFKMDTVSWPPKLTGSYTKGIGGKLYSEVSGWDATIPGQFMNNYGVWDGDIGTKTFKWKIMPTVSGIYKLSAFIDNTGSIMLNNVTLEKAEFWNGFSEESPFGDANALGSWDPLGLNIAVAEVTLVAEQIYEITGTATSSNLKRAGFAATLEAPDGIQLWNSRMVAYTDFILVETDSAIYDQLLAEDNGITLEMDVTLNGITDYYHALAKAEEYVRTSRSAAAITFNYTIEDKYPEPGDILLLSVKDIDLGVEEALFVKVENAKVTGDRQIAIEGSRFDYSQLAWNVEDDYYAIPTPVVNTTINPPFYIEYFPGDSSIIDAPGYLTWPAVFDHRPHFFEIYLRSETPDEDGEYLWQFLGNSTTTRFDLPNLIVTSAIFGIRTVISSTGAKSLIQTTEILELSRSTPPSPVLVSLTSSGDLNESVVIIWSVPITRPDNSIYMNHFSTSIYRGIVNDFSLAQKIQDVIGGLSYKDTPSIYGELFYWIVNVSRAGIVSTPTFCGSLTVDFWERYSDQFRPPSPNNIAAVGAFSNIYVSWESPTYSGGGGHKDSLIFAAIWPQEAVEPVFADAAVIATVSGVNLFAHPVGMSKRYVYWVKERAFGGGISIDYAGPVNASTGQIDGNEIQDASIVNAKIFDLAVDKLTAGVINAAIEINSPVINGGTGSFSGDVTITNPAEVRAALNVAPVISVSLSNEFHTFPASASGVVESYTASGTEVHVYEGTTELLYDGVGISNGTWRVTTNSTNITVGSLVDSGIYLTVEDHTGVADSIDASKIFYTAIGTNTLGDVFTVSKAQNLYKSKAGTVGVNYDVEIESTNGTVFRIGQSINTLLKAHVFYNGVEITETTPATSFKWRRVSYIANPDGDAAWNAAYATGYKEISITIDSIETIATFHCDIIQ